MAEVCIVVRETSGERVVARRGRVARSVGRRLIGLLSRCTLDAEEALILPRCNAIHTWFMRMPIDVVFVREGRVLKTVPRLGPFRFAFAPSADTVIELCQGAIGRAGITVGSRLGWDVS